ncbi:MBT domain-containing protein 1 [Parelaphostrongylus tenuis]|uniref:MBT domain-containing protein 1 n=1 Tax=Parelaphostrongylus tenuis TaxID=148309 RepID=A0AAD5R1C2_PARTN|nr:MBT domain-containing protein 1 [Parelaphostrongylus tenuis]
MVMWTKRIFGEDSEFWVDQSSFYVFHVGWACFNNYGLGSTKEYRKHAQKIAEALSKGEDPPFAPFDATPDKIRSWNFNQDASLDWKKGMRFELMDPLAQMFNELRVASVLEVLKGGYLRVGMDGPDVETECIPLHCTSPFMFPVGYAQKYNIIWKDLMTPKTLTGMTICSNLGQLQHQNIYSVLLQRVPI